MNRNEFVPGHLHGDAVMAVAGAKRHSGFGAGRIHKVIKSSFKISLYGRKTDHSQEGTAQLPAAPWNSGIPYTLYTTEGTVHGPARALTTHYRTCVQAPGGGPTLWNSRRLRQCC